MQNQYISKSSQPSFNLFLPVSIFASFDFLPLSPDEYKLIYLVRQTFTNLEHFLTTFTSSLMFGKWKKKKPKTLKIKDTNYYILTVFMIFVMDYYFSC